MKPTDLLLVWVGGTVGAAVRVATTPPHAGSQFPVAAFVINIVGAGLLGLLIRRLAQRPPDPREQRLGLLLGTGFLGGFTTYSALAADTVQLLRVGATTLAIAYALGTLLIGAATTWLGIIAGRARRPQP